MVAVYFFKIISQPVFNFRCSLAISHSSVDFKLWVSMGHGSSMLCALAIICGEVPIMQNSRLFKQWCDFDVELESKYHI